MSDEMMNTKEVARYLDIHEKQVYALIKTKKIPASRVTGKWLFPKSVIDGWIEANARSGLEQARQKSERIAGALLASGSNDPVLDILQTCLRKAHPEFFVFSANTGSLAGLEALEKGFTDLAWSHLLDPETGEYNIPYLERVAPGVKAVVVNLFYRELGFVIARGNPLGITRFADLVRPGGSASSTARPARGPGSCWTITWERRAFRPTGSAATTRRSTPTSRWGWRSSPARRTRASPRRPFRRSWASTLSPSPRSDST